MIVLVSVFGGTAIAAKKLGLGALSKGAKNRTVGVGKLTYASTTTAIPPGIPDEVLVPVATSCPRGLKPIGGGIKLGADVPNLTVADSYLTATGWAGTVENESASTQSATAIVACAVARRVNGSPPGS
jgi:hypothetical protein